jgi:hypothetical protein
MNKLVCANCRKTFEAVRRNAVTCSPASLHAPIGATSCASGFFGVDPADPETFDRVLEKVAQSPRIPSQRRKRADQGKKADGLRGHKARKESSESPLKLTELFLRNITPTDRRWNGNVRDKQPG